MNNLESVIADILERTFDGYDVYHVEEGPNGREKYFSLCVLDVNINFSDIDVSGNGTVAGALSYSARVVREIPDDDGVNPWWEDYGDPYDVEGTDFFSVRFEEGEPEEVYLFDEYY